MKIKRLVRILVSDTRRNVRSGRIFTARKRSLGQGNIFSSVCQEFCSYGGVCLSACWDTTPPGSRHPPPEQVPQEQAPPKQAVPLGADPHPSSVCWEVRSTSGRYASYWNAILFCVVNILVNLIFQQNHHK